MRYLVKRLGPTVVLFSLSVHAACARSTNVETWTVASAGPEINTKYHDGWSTITPDQLTLYFASNRPGGFVASNIGDDWGLGEDGTPTRYDMYVSHRAAVTDAWGSPTLLPAPINTEHNEHSASVSDDGHWLYFASSRPGGCGSLDLYVSYRDDVSDDAAWQDPKNLGCHDDGGPNTAAIESCPIHHFDEDTQQTMIYFTGSSTPNPATLDYKMTEFDSQSRSAGLAQTINISTDHLDGHIDPVFGYVWAALPTGLGGSDIWRSQRDEHAHEWVPPTNLGPGINTEFEEQLPSPSSDGRTIFFPSNRPGGFGGMDVYSATKD